MDTSGAHTSSPGLSFLRVSRTQFSLHCSDLLLLGTRALSCLPSLQLHQNPPPAEPYRSCVSAQRQRNSDVIHTCWIPTWIQSGEALLNFPKTSLHPLFRARGQSLTDLGQYWEKSCLLPWVGFEKVNPEAWVALTQGKKQYSESPFIGFCYGGAWHKKSPQSCLFVFAMCYLIISRCFS